MHAIIQRNTAWSMEIKCEFSFLGWHKFIFFVISVLLTVH